MIHLVNEPRLPWPTSSVRTSYLVGEQADCLSRHTDTDWFISQDYYLGTLVIRHQLNGELADEAGGHIGYHVVFPWQRQGHATRMLRAALDECRTLGLTRVLLTCAPENEPSRRVVLGNGGIPDGQRHGEDRFWINLGR